jgi:hypothetical protein
MTDPFIPPRSGKAKQRHTATVRPLPVSDESTTDVVRPPTPARFYAVIDELEVETSANDGHRYDILFFCHSAEWFDALAEDLSDLPAMHTAANTANMFAVRLVVTTDHLDTIRATLETEEEEEIDVDLEDVFLSEGWWLEAVFDSDPTHGVPVTVFLPARNSTDPTTIGNTDHEGAAGLVSLTRTRPPRRLIKLRLFSNLMGQ